MSNIPSLFDLIQSSPASSKEQRVVESPVVPNSRRASKRKSSNIGQDRVQEHGEQIEEQIEEEEEETLLSLAEKRDALVNNRKLLQEKIAKLKENIVDLETKVIITENSNNILEPKPKPLSMYEEQLVVRDFQSNSKNSNLDKLRSNLNTLPLSISNNWDLSLSLLKLFQPDLKLEIISNLMMNFNNQTTKLIQFDACYQNIFSLRCLLKINVELAKLEEFSILNSDSKNIPADLLPIISDTKIVKDPTLLIYSLNSYVRLLKLRTEIFIKLFDKYQKIYIINNNKLSSMNINNNFIIKFLKFKDDPLIVFEKDNIKLNIIWKLITREENYGEFDSDIKTILIKKDGTHINYDQLINELILQYGCFNGICMALDSLS
ncbi:hypothetical protein PACTADRAFT_2348 [Pachysolen tannophilus NRRL Y-2460]|uniref:Uncharacterized protein n=1 Tax=Pachysolen tannophilus NRRL Y-2460 TaxID=669874 RepID=A0A1E4TWD4_PACTA|nr:hypothetical protein PACTADRAFT_2348 [Pachysolen tannophilus NRRL Y-2460]